MHGLFPLLGLKKEQHIAMPHDRIALGFLGMNQCFFVELAFDARIGHLLAAHQYYGFLEEIVHLVSYAVSVSRQRLPSNSSRGGIRLSHEIGCPIGPFGPANGSSGIGLPQDAHVPVKTSSKRATLKIVGLTRL
jgi:hypothetical protein